LKGGGERKEAELTNKVKNPTRKTDVWGTPIYVSVLRPGHPSCSLVHFTRRSTSRNRECGLRLPNRYSLARRDDSESAFSYWGAPLSRFWFLKEWAFLFPLLLVATEGDEAQVGFSVMTFEISQHRSRTARAFLQKGRGTLISLHYGELRQWYPLLVPHRQAEIFGESSEPPALSASTASTR